MNIVTFPEFLGKLKEKFSPDLFIETMKLHNIPIKVAHIEESKLQEKCLEHIMNGLKWNPDTTLVFYTPSHIIDQVSKSDDLLDAVPKDDDLLLDLMLSGNSPKKVVCLFLQDMVAENFISMLDQLSKMRAFL